MAQCVSELLDVGVGQGRACVEFGCSRTRWAREDAIGPERVEVEVESERGVKALGYGKNAWQSRSHSRNWTVEVPDRGNRSRTRHNGLRSPRPTGSGTTRFGTGFQTRLEGR